MLLTKLYRPKTKPYLVYRQEVADKLDKAQYKKLVMVSAPAGYGKTTLVSQWIEKNNITCAWYSIDKSDNEPTEFLRYLIAGIQTVNKDFGQSALNLLNSPNRVQIESIVSVLINNLLEIEDDFFVVLDDIHVITQMEVFNAINFLLAHIPQNIHLIILTRSDPPLSISRLRSQNELLEIRISDLSFSVNEISTFFNTKLKLELSESDINSLKTKTEGWIAGLQLSAISMQGITDRSNFIEALAGSNRYIMDYLIEEVLKNQTDEVQEFLLKTSFLKQISAPLCNKILNSNDSQLILEQLDRDNMFVIPLDTERKWYRYHHLFADLLKQRFILKNKVEAQNLHKNASLWLEENGFFEKAIEHAFASKDYKRSIQLISNIIEGLWEQGKHAAILNYGDSLPDDMIRKNPEFCLYYSWILITTGKRDKAEPLIINAKKIIENRINDNNYPETDLQYFRELLGRIYVEYAHLYHDGKDLDKTTSYCKKALEYLSEKDSLWLGWAWFLYGNKELIKGNISQGNEGLKNALMHSKKSGNIYLMSNTTSILAFHNTGQGYYRESYKQCSDLLGFIKKSSYPEIAKVEWTFSGPYSLMSCIESIWTDFDAALENARIGYDLCKNVKNIALVHKITSLYAYPLALYSSGDKAGAEEKLNDLEDIRTNYSFPPFQESIYVGWKIFLLVESDKLDKASEFAKENGIEPKKKITYENEYSYYHYARLLIKSYMLNDAELLLPELYDLAIAGRRIETLVQLRILSAMISKIKGQHEEAVEHMTESMELASDENLLNYFLFDLELTKDIIVEVNKEYATKKTKISKKFIQKLKIAIEKKETQRKNKANSDLSERELETLGLLAEDKSNQEIADKLFVSLNTVKTRLKNIFIKLEVDNRRKAVKTAKEQGLL